MEARAGLVPTSVFKTDESARERWIGGFDSLALPPIVHSADLDELPASVRARAVDARVSGYRWSMRLGVVVLVLLGTTAAADVRREGRISITRANRDGTVGARVEATFTNAPVWGAEIAADGPCTLRKPVPTAVGLSAGTVTLTGTVAPPIPLVEAPTQRGVSYRSRSIPNYYAERAPLTVETSGGSDIPPFTATVDAPIELAGYSPPTSLSRTAGYTATWTAVAGAEMLIVLAAFDERRHSVWLVCRVPDTGTFTIPPKTFKLIPSSLDRVILTVARIAETARLVGDTRVMIDAISSVMSGPFSIGELVEPPKPLPPLEVSPRIFLSVGFGLGGSYGTTWRFQLGQRLSRRFHLVEELNALGRGDLTADTTEEFTSFGAGIRWTPFKPRPSAGLFPLAPFTDITAFHFTAVIGAAARDRITTTMTETTDDSAWSPMASLAVGLFELKGRDWALGPEFRGQLARFDGKFQRDLQMMIAIHLNH